MGNRLSKIYTKTGDDGTTGLGDDSRVKKDSIRVEAMGDLDELNSNIGLLRAEELPGPIDALLKQIQNALFDLGGELSIPESDIFKPLIIEKVETEIDRYNEILPPLKEFLIPAGSKGVAFSHLCRSVCRRAERKLVRLSESEYVKVESRMFINRLSDYFFVLARIIGSQDQVIESMWER